MLDTVYCSSHYSNPGGETMKKNLLLAAVLFMSCINLQAKIIEEIKNEDKRETQEDLSNAIAEAKTIDQSDSTETKGLTVEETKNLINKYIDENNAAAIRIILPNIPTNLSNLNERYKVQSLILDTFKYAIEKRRTAIVAEYLANEKITTILATSTYNKGPMGGPDQYYILDLYKFALKKKQIKIAHLIAINKTVAKFHHCCCFTSISSLPLEAFGDLLIDGLFCSCCCGD